MRSLPLIALLVGLATAAVAQATCGPTTPSVQFAETSGTFPDPTGTARVHAFTVGQDDAILALLRYVPRESATWEVTELRSRALLPLIVIAGDSTTQHGLSGSGCIEQQFVISGFEAGKAYDYELRWVDRSDPQAPATLYATQLVVRVHERFHVEVTTGPVFSLATRRTYELTSRETGEGTTSTRIIERVSDGEGGIVAGATFRPWGYDPRGPLSAENLLFYLGLAVTDKPLENFYLGVGGGGRGFSLVVGAHAFRRDRLRTGFEAGQQDPGISAIGEAVESGWGAAPFISAQIDLATFGKVFGGGD